MPDRHSVAVRLAYVDWRLSVHGEVNRADIMRTFGVSLGQASVDLTEFQRLYPDRIEYDKYRKRYIPAGRAYRPIREYGHDDPNVLRGISLLAAAGHPLGWRD
jgi:hypothetical protein